MKRATLNDLASWSPVAAAAAVGIGVSIAIAFGFAAWQCNSRWSMSGMASSWGPMHGCLVQTSSGRWIPEDRIREVDLNRKPESPT